MSTSVDMGELLHVRSKLNEVSDLRISVNDMLIKAIGLANIDVPEANSQFLGDKIRKYDNVDVSVAVATESGLITPIVTDVTNKSLTTIASNTKDLITKARESKLKPHEFIGGTVTISNLGMSVVDNF